MILKSEGLRSIDGEKVDSEENLSPKRQYERSLAESARIIRSIERMTRYSLRLSASQGFPPNVAHAEIAAQLKKGIGLEGGGTFCYNEVGSPNGSLIVRVNSPAPMTVMVKPDTPMWVVEAPHFSMMANVKVHPFTAPPATALSFKGKRVGDLSDNMGVILRDGSNIAFLPPVLSQGLERFRELVLGRNRMFGLPTHAEPVLALPYLEAAGIIEGVNGVVGAGQKALRCFIDERYPYPRVRQRDAGQRPTGDGGDFDDFTPAG